MRKIIDIETHALFRMLERGSKLGLEYYETKNRAFKTVELEKEAKRKHLSRNHKTYYNYFEDNLSFYVICQKRMCKEYEKYVIMTVIIEKGRE